MFFSYHTYNFYSIRISITKNLYFNKAYYYNKKNSEPESFINNK